jgi:hypothetical protein
VCSKGRKERPTFFTKALFYDVFLIYERVFLPLKTTNKKPKTQDVCRHIIILQFMPENNLIIQNRVQYNSK